VAAPAKALIKACFELAPLRGGMVKPMRVLICGIPNVGKSTLINTLTSKRAAKTGDEAGVTKLEQRIGLADDFYLYDTPGVLWPRIIVAKSGYNLAASGAIGRNAFNEEEVALELLDYLKTHYPVLVEERFKLSGVAAMKDEELLDAIGRKRGALQAGKKVNLQKAAEIAIYDFRSGVMGRMTLETPEEFEQWLVQGQKLDAQRQIKKDAIELDRKIRFKKIPRPDLTVSR
jgi:ribosome biogenesis GTPase A